MNTHSGRTRWKSGLVLIWRLLSFSHLRHVIGQFPRPLCCSEWSIRWPLDPLPSGHHGYSRTKMAQEKKKNGAGPQPMQYRFGPQDKVRTDYLLVMFSLDPNSRGSQAHLKVNSIPAVLNFCVGGGVLGLNQPQLRTGFVCQVNCGTFPQRQILPA